MIHTAQQRSSEIWGKLRWNPGNVDRLTDDVFFQAESVTTANSTFVDRATHVGRSLEHSLYSKSC